jgi:hypothetical protein
MVRTARPRRIRAIPARFALASSVLGGGWATMLTRRYRIWTGLALAALIALGAALAAACDLNPQPLPPGETAFGGSGDGGSLPVAAGPGDGGNTNFGAGNQDGGDAGTEGGQPAAPPGADGGDGGSEDAGDAAVDGSLDGSEDAS